MKSSFSFKRVILLLLLLLNLAVFSLVAAYFWIPGADVVIAQHAKNLNAYFIGSTQDAALDVYDFSSQLTGPKIVSESGSAVSAPSINFYFEGKEYSIKPSVDEAAYSGAVSADRLVYKVSSVSDKLVLANYYRSYVDAPEQLTTLESVIGQLRSIKNEKNLDNDRYVELISKYVQSIPYDTSRAALINDPQAKPGKGDPRFPIQVLGDGTGDCDEKVFLLAALLGHEGYSTAAFLFETERHMSLGIKAQGLGFKETGYEYIETTGVSYISELPDQLAGGVVISSQPQVIVLTAGEGGYSASAVAEVGRIVAERNRATKVVDELKVKMDGLKDNPREYNKYVDQYNRAVEAHNTLNNTSDPQSPEKYKASFKDRTVAIKWLNKNRF